ncbi:hypothetical protein GCM10007879_25050 [Maritalea porphyrae]|uniref:Uncharacterized protein n=2 Tax=Maritalea porphyrae TaxID=880732 RepID=A0ABQ5UT15_9HYPH|nr:hypothetical protein GCM10007879_25050 [Maritalea porphyrae]
MLHNVIKPNNAITTAVMIGLSPPDMKLKTNKMTATIRKSKAEARMSIIEGFRARESAASVRKRSGTKNNPTATDKKNTINLVFTKATSQI